MIYTKWAIIGLGKMAHKFAEDLQSTKDAKLVAVASRNSIKAKEFGDKYNAELHFGSYDEILSLTNIDVVYIATPHVLHTPLAKKFIENGFSVLVEKPIAMNTNELQELIRLSKIKNVFLMEAIWTRFFPTFKKALEIVNSGILGEITTIRADFGFHSKDNDESRVFNKKLGGGALLDVGIYPLFLSLCVLGEPKSIKAHSTWTSTKVDTTTSMILVYNNAQADLHCSITNETDVEGEIYGTKGRLKLHSRFHHAEKLSWEIYDGEKKEFTAPYKGNGYQYEIQEVQDCIKSNKSESDLLPLALSLKLSKLMDRVAEECGIKY